MSTSGNKQFTAVAAGGGAPVIDVWYGPSQKFGNIGIPQVQANILGTVTDPDGLFAVFYDLNGGTEFSLSLGPDTRRLENLGDFVIELMFDDLLPGANQVTITAIDNTFQETVEVVNVDFTPGNVWPLPYTSDWGVATTLDDVSQVVDGLWELEDDAAMGPVVRNTVPGYDRLIAIGDIAWTDYEVEAPMRINSLNPVYASPSNPGPSIGYLLRWIGHQPTGTQPNWGFVPFGAIGVYQYYENGTERLELQDEFSNLAVDTSGKTLTIGSTYIFKMRVETSGAGGGTYSLKMWEEGTAEPASWDISATAPASDLANGCLLLLLHHVDASVGTVTVTPL